jgi:anti-sigma regulatory factor (Ser/Thr protein kinase)
VWREQTLGDSRHLRLDGTPESSREVRHAVSDALTSWGCDGLVNDAVLGASELASNAILHAGTHYELVIRRLGIGARIEVVDRRPDLVPAAVPTSGNARALTSRGTTGRGLQIVTSLANRWGYTTSPTSKSVWMEISDQAATDSREPVIVEGHHEPTDPTARLFHFESLPVRAAVGSGIQVEELIREIQLASRTARIEEAEWAALQELLDLSAPARLLGRHAAFSAAAQNETRFSLDVRLAPGAIAALGALNGSLTDMSERLGASIVPLPTEVTDFRRWIIEEIAQQMSGDDPAVCPLPD